MSDVSLTAAVFRGLLSFLSPCVLPLVPPYLVLHGRRSSTIFARRAERRPRATRACARCLRSRLLDRFRCAGRHRLVPGSWSGISAAGAGRRRGHHPHGAAFSRHIRAFRCFRERRVSIGEAGRPIAAYVMGLAFAFGWTPCIGPVLADPDACGGRDGGARAPAACRLFARPRHSVPDRGVGAGAVRVLARFRIRMGWSRRRWARCWSSRASLPDRLVTQLSLAAGDFPGAGAARLERGGGAGAVRKVGRAISPYCLSDALATASTGRFVNEISLPSWKVT